MPRKTSASGFSLSIDDDFDETKSYPVRLYDLDEVPSKVENAKDGDMALVWKLNLYREDGTAFGDPRTGDIFEVWEWSSDSMFPTAKGRGFVHAFLGRELTNEEIDQMIEDGSFYRELVGKTATGSFEIRRTTDGNERLKLLLLRPRRVRATAAAAPESRPEPEPVTAAPAATPQHQRRRIDD